MYDRTLTLLTELKSKRKANRRKKNRGGRRKADKQNAPQAKVGDTIKLDEPVKKPEPLASKMVGQGKGPKPGVPDYKKPDPTLERPSQKFYDRIGKVIPGVAKLSKAIKGERERRLKKAKEGGDPRTAYERGLAGRGETVVGRASRALRALRNPERDLERTPGSVYN